LAAALAACSRAATAALAEEEQLVRVGEEERPPRRIAVATRYSDSSTGKWRLRDGTEREPEKIGIWGRRRGLG
jgi:hypothetical protein